MFAHVVDINLPKQGSNVPFEGNRHLLSPFLALHSALRSAFARRSAFGGGFSSILLRVNAQGVP